MSHPPPTTHKSSRSSRSHGASSTAQAPFTRPTQWKAARSLPPGPIIRASRPTAVAEAEKPGYCSAGGRDQRGGAVGNDPAPVPFAPWEGFQMSNTVLLIHGAWLNSRSWDAVKARYEAKGFTVVAPDWPYDDR